MQVVNKNLPVFESGKIVLSTDNVKVVEINFTNKTIDVDVRDKAFLKRAISLRGEISGSLPELTKIESEKTGKKKKSAGSLALLKTVAETLSGSGVTLTLSFKGARVVTLGSNAHPRLLQIITHTKAVAVNSLPKLIRMII